MSARRVNLIAGRSPNLVEIELRRFGFDLHRPIRERPISSDGYIRYEQDAIDGGDDGKA